MWPEPGVYQTTITQLALFRYLHSCGMETGHPLQNHKVPVEVGANLSAFHPLAFRLLPDGSLRWRKVNTWKPSKRPLR